RTFVERSAGLSTVAHSGGLACLPPSKSCAKFNRKVGREARSRREYPCEETEKTAVNRLRPDRPRVLAFLRSGIQRTALAACVIVPKQEVTKWLKSAATCGSFLRAIRPF